MNEKPNLSELFAWNAANRSNPCTAMYMHIQPGTTADLYRHQQHHHQHHEDIINRHRHQLASTSMPYGDHRAAVHMEPSHIHPELTGGFVHAHARLTPVDTSSCNSSTVHTSARTNCPAMHQGAAAVPLCSHHSSSSAYMYDDMEACSYNPVDYKVQSKSSPSSSSFVFNKMIAMIAKCFLNDERDRRYYADVYSCVPPPFFILTITLIEVSIDRCTGRSRLDALLWLLTFLQFNTLTNRFHCVCSLFSSRITQL